LVASKLNVNNKNKF